MHKVVRVVLVLSHTHLAGIAICAAICAALGDLTHVEILRCLAAHSIARPKMRATSLGIAGLGRAGPGYNTREVWNSRPWE